LGKPFASGRLVPALELLGGSGHDLCFGPICGVSIPHSVLRSILA
jgi:hypothetical protein